MSTAAPTTAVSTPKPWSLWGGRVLSMLVVAALAFSAVMKLTQAPAILENSARFGYTPALMFNIGLVEILCLVLYAVPQTSVLGAILVTAYLGGATATHVRISDPFITPILLGVFAWGGLFLRDARLRALLPLRRAP
ncbi:DoxX family protein [Myxococcus landrumensis]|uniref:DoxX family protein n=1 Tax=Myxococcus landrumensis TaxID=2813577 RepID=A0ABX7MWF2_9BACT|nr:DoxX family protein [Myxococcus landrumus]QSQ10724.1 DoxX family protein [Myxococcus landrumus]